MYVRIVYRFYIKHYGNLTKNTHKNLISSVLH